MVSFISSLSFFYFITTIFKEPKLPKISNCTSTTCDISWEPVVFANNFLPFRRVNAFTYHIEFAEGKSISKSNSMVNRFKSIGYDSIEGTPLDEEFIQVFENFFVFSTTVIDLRPSTIYYYRIIIKYYDCQFSSTTGSFCTECCEPSAPSMPRIYLDTHESESSFLHPVPSILVRWSASLSNGFIIDKYQLSMKQINVDGDVIPLKLKESKVKYKRSPTKGIFLVSQIDSHNSNTFINDKVDEMQITNSDWTVVYSNIAAQCYVDCPGNTLSEWHLRVRSHNKLGWSEYSPILVINSQTHPSLFSKLRKM